MGRYSRSIITLFFAIVALSALAGDDFGMDYSLGLEAKVVKRLTFNADVELRTRNNSQTFDRWAIGGGFQYKFNKHLKVGIGYIQLYDDNREKITYHDDGALNKWRPSYWGFRHRFFVGVTGSYDWQRFSFSLRERYQFTLRPAKETECYDFDDAEWSDVEMVQKKKNTLRSRLQVEYNIRHSKFTPFANVEVFNSMELDKTRFQVGTSFKLSKEHSFDFYYQYQIVNASDDDNDVNTHYICVGYTYKF